MADFLQPRQLRSARALSSRSTPPHREQRGPRPRRTARAAGFRSAAAAPGRRATDPSARRTASSRWRAAARASSRLAMLAHAMSSTTPTAPNSISSGGADAADQIVLQRDQPRRPRRARRIVVRVCRARFRARRPSSRCCACSTVDSPGFRRPIAPVGSRRTARRIAERRSRCNLIGAHTSTSVSTERPGMTEVRRHHADDRVPVVVDAQLATDARRARRRTGAATARR